MNPGVSSFAIISGSNNPFGIHYFIRKPTRTSEDLQLFLSANPCLCCIIFLGRYISVLPYRLKRSNHLLVPQSRMIFDACSKPFQKFEFHQSKQHQIFHAQPMQ